MTELKNQIILSDNNRHVDFLPFSYTRPIGDLRVGILTIKEKYEILGAEVIGFDTESYLSHKFGSNMDTILPIIVVDGAIIPTLDFLNYLSELPDNTVLKNSDGDFIAFKGFADSVYEFLKEKDTSHSIVQTYKNELKLIQHIWDMFSFLETEIKSDFKLITSGRESAPIDSSNIVKGAENIFIEPGAIVFASVLNATYGPIYIGKDAEVMEGCLIRGGFALGDHAQLKMGTKIYGPTSIGPECRIGGEVNNSLFYGYSNKGHDGFIGNSVIGEWCNIGADSNNSNLKNNYEEVKLWNYSKKSFVKTGLQFCGLFMGDHTKCGINTMFNTGTVTGVSANIFGAGFPRNYIPSFAWGGASGFTTYHIDKAFETAQKVMHRRGKELNEVEKDILSHIYKVTLMEGNF